MRPNKRSVDILNLLVNCARFTLDVLRAIGLVP